MKIFISWSGTRSQKTAKELNTWIPKIIQSADPWISTEMDRGINWLNAVNKSLDDHSFGILCITTGNFEAPWLNYEAGALSKHLGDAGRVIPYLLDFRSPSDLNPPLGQFNASLADEEGTWSLIKTLNNSAEYKQSEPNLRETFDAFWPKLHEKLDEIRLSSKGGTSPRLRSSDSKLDELLKIARHIQSTVDRRPSASRPALAIDALTEARVKDFLAHYTAVKLDGPNFQTPDAATRRWLFEWLENRSQSTESSESSDEQDD